MAICAEALRETCGRNGYRVYALAIMPEHVHLVLEAGDSGHNAPKVLNNIKGVTSRRVFQASPELKLDLRSVHLWADEYHAQLLLDLVAVKRACLYVKENPLKLGLPSQRFPWLESSWPALQGGDG